MSEPAGATGPPGLRTVALEWTRIGVTGFGGPPAHIALLRRLMVERRRWMDAAAFEDANAVCGLLPGPASTQLSILCAHRVAGVRGAIVGGLGFILPAVILILAASSVVLAHGAPLWVRGAAAGASAAVAAVAARAGAGLLGPSLERVRADRARRLRWLCYLGAGTAAAILLGAYLVLVLLGSGLVELGVQRGRARIPGVVIPAAISTGGLGAVAWTALKVGALSFGGGFVIVPLMQGDAVHVHHWMTNARFLDAVALGQITPGPVVATVAAVGYAAHGLTGGMLAAGVAFSPSFVFVLAGGRHFERLRANPAPRAFLDGAGPAAIGAIFGAAVTLAGALTEGWQVAVLAAAAGLLLVARRGVVTTLVLAGATGMVAVLAGAPLG